MGGLVTSQNMSLSLNLCSCERSNKESDYGDRVIRKPLIDIDEKTEEQIIEKAATEIITIQPDAKRIHTVDKMDATNSTNRLEVIVNMSDDDNMEKLLLKNYATPGSDNESSSSEDEKEREKIKQIKSEQIKNKQMTQSNVLRQSSETAWNDSQIDSLSCEMTAELLNLKKSVSDLHELDLMTKSLSQFTQEIIVSDETDEDLPESNLYRDESQAKWDNPLIDKQKDEMTKHLIHLAKLQNESESNKKRNESNET